MFRGGWSMDDRENEGKYRWLTQTKDYEKTILKSTIL